MGKRRGEQDEKDNEAEHTIAGTMVECQCCYIDVPPNRVVTCEGSEQHPFCFTCVRKAAETQIGLIKYELECFDTSGCASAFSRSQLKHALGDALMEKLEDLQQQDEIRRAGLEGLEDCPFCDFKAVCPPVEEDKEFRCCNPDCEIVSCRLCKLETHIPLSCNEAKEERGISNRHLVEEAMTEAFIRPCPKCKVPIVKELGCNKMVCSKCNTAMCYVCRRDITGQGYDHFSHRGGYCSPNDDFNDQAQREVDQAAKKTIQRLQAENPELRREDLTVRLPRSNPPQRPRNPPDAARRARVGPHRPPIAALNPDPTQGRQRAMPQHPFRFPQMPIPQMLRPPTLNFGNQPAAENGPRLFEGFPFRPMEAPGFPRPRATEPALPGPHQLPNGYLPGPYAPPEIIRDPVYGPNPRQGDAQGRPVFLDPRIPPINERQRPAARPGHNPYTPPYQRPHLPPPLPNMQGYDHVNREVWGGRW